MVIETVAALAMAVTVGLVAHRVFTVAGTTEVKKTHAWRLSTEVEVTKRQFWLVVIGAGVTTFLAAYALTSILVLSLMPALVVATLPRGFYGRRRAVKLAAVQEAWPDGLRDLVSSIRSGSSLPSALEDLATYGPLPLRDAFLGYDSQARSFGVVAGLESVRDRLADPTTDRVIEVLELAYQRGGAVVPEILEDLARATTGDVWTAEQVRTEALEQKINSRVVFVMPWVVLVIMTGRSEAFREFYSSPAGLLVILIGAALSLIGIAIASRLGAQPTEPRVFRGRLT